MLLFFNLLGASIFENILYARELYTNQYCFSVFKNSLLGTVLLILLALLLGAYKEIWGEKRNFGASPGDILATPVKQIYKTVEFVLCAVLCPKKRMRQIAMTPRNLMNDSNFVSYSVNSSGSVRLVSIRETPM